MNQINKYKQDNNNAGSPDHRIVTLVKTPTVQMLTICNVRRDILDAINELAAKQDRSRSSFVRRELERIVVEYQARESISQSR